jgi:predicted AAA+ superfamily ATPase
MGRKELYEMITLDFEEFLDFRDEEEIRNMLFKNKKIPFIYKKRIEELFMEYITYGGYPEVVLQPDKTKKIRKLDQLSTDYIKKDIYDANIAEIDKFFSLLKILASQVGELVNASELSNTLELDAKTVEKYLYIMRKSFTIALHKPFRSNIRAELIKMPKVFFFDLGLRNSLLDNFNPIFDRLDK